MRVSKISFLEVKCNSCAFQLYIKTPTHMDSINFYKDIVKHSNETKHAVVITKQTEVNL